MRLKSKEDKGHYFFLKRENKVQGYVEVDKG